MNGALLAVGAMLLAIALASPWIDLADHARARRNAGADDV